MTQLVTPAEEAVLRRFAATVREQGSRKTPRALRAEARMIIIQGHLAGARQARREGRPEAAKAHLAWVNRLAAE